MWSGKYFNVTPTDPIVASESKRQGCNESPSILVSKHQQSEGLPESLAHLDEHVHRPIHWLPSRSGRLCAKYGATVIQGAASRSWRARIANCSGPANVFPNVSLASLGCAGTRSTSTRPLPWGGGSFGKLLYLVSARSVSITTNCGSRSLACDRRRKRPTMSLCGVSCLAAGRTGSLSSAPRALAIPSR